MQPTPNAALYVTVQVKVVDLPQGIDMFGALSNTVRSMPRDEDHEPSIYVVNENNVPVY